MRYVKQLDINGVEARQTACIELHGAPNAATAGAVGVLGIDVDSPTHEMYKCVAVNGGIYTWEICVSGGSGTGGGVIVEVGYDASTDVATASHSASEIFALVQGGATVVAVVNGKDRYPYKRATINIDGDATLVEFSFTEVGEQLDAVTTYGINIDEHKDCTFWRNEFVGGVTPIFEPGGVETLNAGESAYVNIDNSDPTAPVISFGIPKGPQGPSYTLTEDDKALIVAQVVENLGGNPIFGYVDGDNNIVVRGSLAVGTYSVKYEMEDGSTVDIGDLILGQDVHCSITKNLTNCTINNSATQVNVGDSYSATISANSGYVLSSVKITMGGTEVTSSVYSNGVITIGSVTGNVVITASAVKEAAKTYTITNNLTNCTNSNSLTVVEEGSAYSATISASEGYTLDSVTATMGGSAVTVTNGVINIASVTGNIVITAVANVDIKNWIANSENADGTQFVGTNGEDGYKTNTRLSSSKGTETTQSGVEVTGFIPVTKDDTLYFKGVTVSGSNEYTCFYDSSHTMVGNGAATSTFFGTMSGEVVSKKISSIGVEPVYSHGDKIAYMRISASGIDANSIITKNQPIE